ncbi:hypothetical protein C1889_30495 [Pseudomonas sp. FW507-12TSA]|nr:hypothetical protein C1889_30495 [Pseudomonas sp. FW507-12TSA]
MLYKNILIHSIDHSNNRNPIISVMGDDITRDLITNFCQLMLSCLPYQKSAFGKLISDWLGI